MYEYFVRLTNVNESHIYLNYGENQVGGGGGGGGVDLLALLAFLPSVISSFFTQNNGALP